jgi:hypothetical protein
MTKNRLLNLAKQEWFLYTLTFILICIAGFAPLFKNHLSAIWYIDGIGQYYPAFLYIGKYIRAFFTGLFQGNFNLPVYDLSIGMGEDIIGVLNYYGFGDPINLIAVIANQTNGSYIFTFTYFLRLYLAGWSFIFYCRKMALGKYPRIFSGLIFAFCGFASHGALMYIEWLSVLIYFPLMLAGAEDIIKKTGRYRLLAFAVCYGSLCGFYYLYMSSIVLALYFIVRLIALYGLKNILHSLLQCIHALGLYLLGIGLASPILFPAVRAYFQSERNSQLLNILLDVNQYKPNIQNTVSFVMKSVTPARTYAFPLGILVIEWIVILLYFLTRWNRRKVQLFTGLVLSVLAVSMPITGYFFNGFGETNDRWVFLIHFLFSVIFAAALTSLQSITIATCESYATYPRNVLYTGTMLLVFANIVFNLFFSFSARGAGWKEEFIEAENVSLYTTPPKPTFV